jgi:hypothetical protein
MTVRPRLIASLLFTCICLSTGVTRAAPAETLRSVAPNELRAPSDFDVIADRAARSRALFLEASRVLLHPRCKNCHPSGDSPLQGMDARLHDPPVVRGPDNHGVVGMRCATCHQDRNQALARVPGAPKWALAPLEMAWVGRTPRQVCEQLKDPQRNGGRTLDAVAEHNAHDELVAWGWSPGADREPAPGTQAAFAAIFRAWMATGAVCPLDGERP